MEIERRRLRGEDGKLRTVMGSGEIVQNLDHLWATLSSIVTGLEKTRTILVVMERRLADAEERINRINEREGLTFSRLPRKTIDLEAILLSPNDSPSFDPTS